MYDGAVLRAGYARLRERLHPAVDVFYSLKANPNVSVCAILGSLGAGAEVSSTVELETAVRAGVPASRIIFLGPGKTVEDLRSCLSHGIGAVVCESLAEARTLAELADGRPTDVLLRVNPAFETKGSGLAMGGKPRQFGIDQDQVDAAIAALGRHRSLRLRGFHAYMGTRFLRAADIVHNTRGILAMAADLAHRNGIDLRTVDIGGGWGIPYFDNEQPLDLDEVTAGVNQAVAEFLTGHTGCRIIMELGRFLAAPCGTYVTRALYVKESSGHRFVVADGGTNHHMAAVGIGSFVGNETSRSNCSPGPVSRQTARSPSPGRCAHPTTCWASRSCCPTCDPGICWASGGPGPTARPPRRGCSCPTATRPRCWSTTASRTWCAAGTPPPTSSTSSRSFPSDPPRPDGRPTTGRASAKETPWTARPP